MRMCHYLLIQTHSSSSARPEPKCSLKKAPPEMWPQWSFEVLEAVRFVALEHNWSLSEETVNKALTSWPIFHRAEVKCPRCGAQGMVTMAGWSSQMVATCEEPRL